MVVHVSAVALYLGLLGLIAVGEKCRVRKSQAQLPRTAGPCWVSPDSGSPALHTPGRRRAG